MDLCVVLLGQPPFGLPPIGLPPIGLPPFGLNPIGLGLPPIGLSPFGLTPIGLPPIGLPPFGLPPFGLPPFGIREAPLRLASPLFGHCPNGNCTPPPHSNGHFFPGRFERLCQITVLRVYNCHKESWQALNPLLTKGNAQLNFNFHCISAPNRG